MPLLFQRVAGLENRPISADGIRHLLTGALAASGITGTDGKPLTFWPHDFRRDFTTDAILNGMPPHITQLILGHENINTTMGYKNSQELHQPGEKLQVSSSQDRRNGVPLVLMPAVRPGKTRLGSLLMHDPLIRRLASNGKVKSAATRGPGSSWPGSAPQAGVFSGFQYLTPPLAVYPEEAINGHRAFIAQRRTTRPSEEYRTPTDAEWDEFLGHFQRRRVALGDCGRAYSTPCIHEHSCIRCPLLRIDPAQRGRLEEIRDNLHARIAEAEREGWTGEAEGLKVSLAAATSKLAQADATTARRAEHVHLGIPAYRDIAAATLTAEGPREH